MKQDIPYSPCNEKTNLEQIFAAHGEALRRNAKFREVAAEWIRSENFRRQHVPTAEYHNLSIHFQRCALDWLLTPADRLSLAKFQVKNRCWFRDQRFNFGPIRCELLVPPEKINVNEIEQAYRLEPRTDTRFPLRLDQTWPQTPPAFRDQFRFAVSEPTEFAEITQILGDITTELQVIGRYLAEGDPHNEKPVFARVLTEFGERLHDLAQTHKIFAFPNLVMTKRQLQTEFAKIEETYKKLGLLRPQNQYPRKSYFGTTEGWKWYSVAEQRGLDWRKPSDLYELAKVYSEDIRRQFNARRRNAQAHGFTQTPVPSKVLRARRSTLKHHCESIQKWIDYVYPPSAYKPLGP